jgi:hypothetical protein
VKEHDTASDLEDRDENIEQQPLLGRMIHSPWAISLCTDAALEAMPQCVIPGPCHSSWLPPTGLATVRTYVRFSTPTARCVQQFLSRWVRIIERSAYGDEYAGVDLGEFNAGA